MSWKLSPEGEIFNVSTSNLTNAYWSFTQMLTHHAFGGCEMRTGDLIGTGTITGEVSLMYSVLRRFIDLVEPG